MTALSKTFGHSKWFRLNYATFMPNRPWSGNGFLKCATMSKSALCETDNAAVMPANPPNRMKRIAIGLTATNRLDSVIEHEFDASYSLSAYSRNSRANRLDANTSNGKLIALFTSPPVFCDDVRVDFRHWPSLLAHENAPKHNRTRSRSRDN